MFTKFTREVLPSWYIADSKRLNFIHSQSGPLYYSRLHGYATGALLGTILASPGRRHILLTGEGSLQMTVQELSTVMRPDLKPFIFLINNAGYTVERAVLGMSAKYNDVANWRYSELPNVFTRERKAETYLVQTSVELQKVLDAPHPGMVFVESVMAKYDAPIDLIVGGHALADSDYGTPGPQAVANSQIPTPRRAATSSWNTASYTVEAKGVRRPSTKFDRSRSS